MRLFSRVATVVLAVALVVPSAVVPASAATTYQPDGVWPKPTYHMFQAYGVAADPAGNVYVADTMNNRVVKYGKNGGAQVWGGYGVGDKQFNQPYGIAVSPNGFYVYVADTFNNRIQKFTSTGTFLEKWGKEGGPDAYGAGDKEFDHPYGVAVDAQGYVYVADTGNERVQKFKPNGDFDIKWGTPGSSAKQFYDPRGIAVSPVTGDIYVTDMDASNSNVQRFKNDGTFVCEWGSWGKGPAQFQWPWGIAIDKDDNVYVSEFNKYTDRIQKFTATGDSLGSWGKFLLGDYDNYTGGPVMNQPTGLAILGTQTQSLLVCDTYNDRLREYDLGGNTLSFRGSWGIVPGRFDNASGVAVDGEGNVFVTSMSRDGSQFPQRRNHSLQKFSATGEVLSFAPRSMLDIRPTNYVNMKYQAANGYFYLPSSVAVDPFGDVYVAEHGNDRVQRLSNGLDYVTQWGEFGDGYVRFNNPSGIAVGMFANERRIFVADTNNNRIAVFYASGGEWFTFGTSGSGNGQFNKPQGIAVSPDGLVYVADTGNHRVQYFDINGTYLGQWGSQGAADDINKFSSPQGVGVGPAGEVYVADTGNDRVKKFRGNGAPLSMFGSTGADPGQFMSPRGVTVSKTGIIYVADTLNHRIQYFTPPVEVIISGVTEGGDYNTSVTPKVEFYGGSLVSTSTTLNGNPWQPQTIAADGNYSLYAYARDGDGDVATKTVTFQIDRVKPVTSSNAAAQYNNTAVITLQAQDDRTGVDKTFYLVDGGTAKQGTAVTVTGYGDHTISFWSVDKAGNVESAKTASFKINDTIAPQTTCNASASTYADSAVIQLSATDAGAGVALTKYRLDGLGTQTGTLVLCATAGTHTLEYWSEDIVGNVEATKTASFTIKKASVVNISRSPATVSYNGTSKLTATLKSSAGSLIPNRSLKLYRSSNNVNWTYVTTLSSTTGSYVYTTPRLRIKQYYRLVFDEDTDFAASSRTTYVAARAYLGPPAAPTSARRNTYVGMYGSLKPKHLRGTNVAVLYGYRYENRRWVLRAKGTAKAYDYFGNTRYSGRLLMRYPGRWRVRAYHTDAAHAPTYSGYDYITIK